MTDRNHTPRGDIDFIPFRYQGQYHDIKTGLYYNRFRYYDPQTGNYTQQDPIGLQGGNPTLYAYVHNPHAWVDPFGLSECSLWKPTPKKADLWSKGKLKEHYENMVNQNLGQSQKRNILIWLMPSK